MKKLLSLLAVTLFIAAVITGCVSGGSTKDKNKLTVAIPGLTEDEIGGLKKCIEAFEKQTGISVDLITGNEQLQKVLDPGSAAGDRPDIALIGDRKQFFTCIDNNMLVELDQKTKEAVKSNFSPGFIDFASANSITYGVPFMAGGTKSIVYYPKKEWKKQGYKVPKTWNELIALCNLMVSRGQTPWTIGIESGGATGWTATDWLEDIFLRTAGVKKYKQWINHEITFSDPAVQEAFTYLDRLWFTEGYVLQRRKDIAKENFGEAARWMFESPPKALMHRQGNFITLFLPEKIQENSDEEVGVFVFPPINPQQGVPLVGYASVWTGLNQKPEVFTFLHYFSSGKAVSYWDTTNQYFAHKDQDMGRYKTGHDRYVVKLLMETEYFLGDASDQMPRSIGYGLFWEEMTRYTTGEISYKELAQNIDSQWPADK